MGGLVCPSGGTDRRSRRCTQHRKRRSRPAHLTGTGSVHSAAVTAKGGGEFFAQPHAFSAVSALGAYRFSPARGRLRMCTNAPRARLEIRYTVLPYRGFESLLLRQTQGPDAMETIAQALLSWRAVGNSLSNSPIGPAGCAPPVSRALPLKLRLAGFTRNQLPAGRTDPNLGRGFFRSGQAPPQRLSLPRAR